jgi:hypothetical protein
MKRWGVGLVVPAPTLRAHLHLQIMPEGYRDTSYFIHTKKLSHQTAHSISSHLLASSLS